MATETRNNNFKINILNQSQYDAAVLAGIITNNDNDMYLVEGTQWTQASVITVSEDIKTLNITLPTGTSEVTIYYKANYKYSNDATASGIANGTINVNGSVVYAGRMWYNTADYHDYIHIQACGGLCMASVCINTDANDAQPIYGGNRLPIAAATINTVAINAPYNYVTDTGDVGRIATGSYFEVWAR